MLNVFERSIVGEVESGDNVFLHSLYQLMGPIGTIRLKVRLDDKAIVVFSYTSMDNHITVENPLLIIRAIADGYIYFMNFDSDTHIVGYRNIGYLRAGHRKMSEAALSQLSKSLGL